ncbi:glutamate--tRNA ligase [Candidatus Kaiserbacteria bacterium RIFCSPHIGHO2_02_FULL_49_11]|uniref:Glutamate--tRNA ligase n=1 Tax=Candidatus Kaiserbacteria bacterium RIFCSPHIGHO2_02_FULL_49_11 TaxID=1798489 RepID=A0A1F6D006_9BACT|nr:MAG: glutamate--tRNA ligase [Candidatus Kaiserbacteria bacterium RIFCSPHIGHO2_02_FULL_49_11]
MREKKVITRIAPSPTGPFHIGTARSALFNYLFARHHKGSFIVRIEDTDKERSTKESEKDILDGLAALGISYDALYRQSERTDIYTTYLRQLIEAKRAYLSKEESTTQPGKEVQVVRLKNPGEKISFNDSIRGDIEFDTKELGDFVIARSITEPLYHLAVVIDDHEMGVTHVIRGEEHISNTPRQILIGRALGIREPQYAHIPLILAPDRSKMSKRKGSTSVSEFLHKGYLSEAIINYLALLGWNPGSDREIFTLPQLVHEFSLEHVQKSGAIFDIQKLNWFNREHLKRLPHAEFIEKVVSYFDERVTTLPQYRNDIVEKIAPILIERISTLSELTELSKNGEFDYYFSEPQLGVPLVWKEDSKETAARHLSFVSELLKKIPDNAFTEESVKNCIWEYATKEGRGSVLWPMRVALSGKEKSPDPFVLSSVLGKEKTLTRLGKARDTLL